MFPPVERQVIFLSKDTPIVSVGLWAAEVSYANQNKTAWKSEVVQMLGYLFRNISRLYMTFDEKGKVVKSVQPIKTPVRTRSYFQVCGAWGGWKGDFFQIRVITKLPNSEQSCKEKVKTHNYTNRQKQT